MGVIKGQFVCISWRALQNRIHFWFSVVLPLVVVKFQWLLSFHQRADFSDGRRWSVEIRDNDVSAGGLNEQWLLPKLENSTEPTLDVDKKTDYIQLKPQLHWKFQKNNLVGFDILVDPLICNWSSDWYRMSRYRSEANQQIRDKWAVETPGGGSRENNGLHSFTNCFLSGLHCVGHVCPDPT